MMGEKRQRELEIFAFMGNSGSLLASRRGHFILSALFKVPSVTIVGQIIFHICSQTFYRQFCD